MACKFKPGDVIVGNDLADERYFITNKGWIGQVISVSRDCFSAKTLYKSGKLGTLFPALGYEYFNVLEPEFDAKHIKQMAMIL